MRRISEYELNIISALANHSFAVEGMVNDVHPEDRNYHHIELVYPDGPWQGGGYGILADCIATDFDGSLISLLILGSRSGRPYELEIQRFDGCSIQKLPLAEEWVPAHGNKI